MCNVVVTLFVIFFFDSRFLLVFGSLCNPVGAPFAATIEVGKIKVHTIALIVDTKRLQPKDKITPIVAGHGAPTGSHRAGDTDSKREPKNRITNNVTTTLYNRECNVPFSH